jgi:hypothetical protein
VTDAGAWYVEPESELAVVMVAAVATRTVAKTAHPVAYLTPVDQLFGEAETVLMMSSLLGVSAHLLRLLVPTTLRLRRQRDIGRSPYF